MVRSGVPGKQSITHDKLTAIGLVFPDIPPVRPRSVSATKRRGHLAGWLPTTSAHAAVVMGGHGGHVHGDVGLPGFVPVREINY